MGKTKIGGKKLTPKRVITPKGAQVGLNWSFLFVGGDIIKSCAQSKFEAKWLTIALFSTDRTFWDQTLPHLQKEIRNLHTATF